MDIALKKKIDEVAREYLKPFDKGYSLDGDCHASITPQEGEWIYDFIKKHDFDCGIEIGTGTGYSSLYLGSALRELWTVDNGAIALTLNRPYGDVKRIWRKMHERMDFNNVHYLTELENGAYDVCEIAFIDGDHVGHAPLRDFLDLGPYMVPYEPHYIIWHDTLVPYVADAIKTVVADGYNYEAAPLAENETYGMAITWK